MDGRVHSLRSLPRLPLIDKALGIREHMSSSESLFSDLQLAANGNRPNSAVAIARDLIAKRPGHAPTWLFYGRSLGELARYREATDALKKALSLAPENKQATVLAQLGHLSALQGKFEVAEQWYREAHERAEARDEENLWLGEILFRQGRVTEAESVLVEATSLGNENVIEAWSLLGTVLASQMRYREALKCYEKVLALDSSHEKALAAADDLEQVMKYLADHDSDA